METVEPNLTSFRDDMETFELKLTPLIGDMEIVEPNLTPSFSRVTMLPRLLYLVGQVQVFT